MVTDARAAPSAVDVRVSPLSIEIRFHLFKSQRHQFRRLKLRLTLGQAMGRYLMTGPRRLSSAKSGNEHINSKEAYVCANRSRRTGSSTGSLRTSSFYTCTYKTFALRQS